MPPKQKITKEMLLEQAFSIAEKEGITAVTSRSVAKALGCSVQPVFSQFPTMEDLRKAAFDYACGVLVKELSAFEESPDFFMEAVRWVIDLARNRPNMFRLLYLSDCSESRDPLNVLMSFESSTVMTAKMQAVFGLEEHICKDILLRGCMLLMGTGTMICTGHLELSNEQAMEIMRKTVSDMVTAAKCNKLTEG